MKAFIKTYGMLVASLLITLGSIPLYESVASYFVSVNPLLKWVMDSPALLIPMFATTGIGIILTLKEINKLLNESKDKSDEIKRGN